MQTLQERGGTLADFNYDGQNRLQTAYEHNYLYDSAGRTTLFEGGAGFTFDSVHPHAVNTVNSVDRYDYDANR
ncbi:MAG: hypothetical protein IPK16_26205 [Anaerolineales bacterium]|nr:hypothetical protein [Anaerolineales bacterium]